MAMTVSKRGLAEIASHEGIVNYPYFDSVGVRTVGIGHTANAGPPDPSKAPREYSVAEIMDIFARDIGKFEKRVNARFTRRLSQAQFDAAVSFDFNTGGIHRASWVDHFNAGNDAAAKKAFMNWSKPPEIIPRRRKERDLFFNGTYSSNGYANLYPASHSGKVLWGQGKRVNVLELMDSKPAASIDNALREEMKRVAERQPKPAPTGKSGGKKTIAALIALVAGGAAAVWASLTGWLCAIPIITNLCGG